MRPIDFVEIMADRIGDGPQATPEVYEALRQLRRQGAQSWRLKAMWELLSEDIRGRPGGQIGADQSANALVNGMCLDTKQQRLDPMQLRDTQIAAGL